MPRNITITFADGTSHVYQGAPDDVTPDQVEARASKEFGKKVTALDGGRGSSVPEPSMLDSVKQGAGNLVAGAVRGAGSIGATLVAPYDIAKDALAGKGLSLESNRERRRAIDEGLGMMGAETDSLLYKGGKLAGEIAGTAGAGGLAANALGRSTTIATNAPNVLAAIRTAGMSGGSATGVMNPLVRAAGGGITGGASAALVDPESAGTGAMVGAALPGALKAAGIGARAVGNALRPAVANPDLARRALDAGVPLGVADVSQNRMIRGLRSVLNDAPLIGGIGERQGQAVQQGFNRAVGRTFGAEADSLTPEVLDAARKRMGGEFDRLWGRNALQFDGELFNQLQTLRASANKLPQGDGARLASWIDDIESKMVAGPGGELSMPGDVANRFQSKLREQATKATGFLKDDLQNLRGAVLGAFKRSISADDAQALAANMGQYRAFKTVEPLLNGAEAGVAGREAGNVPAALLPNAVRQQYGSRIAESPFADLTQIGSQYVADRVARTGGGPRAMIQNSAVGAALAGSAYVNPLLAATMLPVAAGVQAGLGSPRLNALLLNPATMPASLRQALANVPARQALYRAAPVLAADE